MFEAKFTLVAPAFALVAAAIFSHSSSREPVARRLSESRTDAAAQNQQTRRLFLTLAPTGNEARYRVREQLVGFSLPNDAVGKTTKLSGALVIQSNGTIVKEGSKFTVDLASLTSDQQMRDGFVRDRTLQTAQYPTAVFAPASAEGLPASLPVAADLNFRLIGDFTVHGVTRPTTWQVTGKMLSSGEFTGSAKTAFKFGDFGLTIPRVQRVMSVVDSITLELDLHLLVGTAPSGG